MVRKKPAQNIVFVRASKAVYSVVNCMLLSWTRLFCSMLKVFHRLYPPYSINVLNLFLFNLEYKYIPLV
ncbi:hypothetical protein DWY90_11935 [Coprococcus sp. AF27-8]|nr:hypothetical protein [Clostridioides difficile]RJV71748.1 hypothetical protein DWY90_11935 [Coprococcus sp. AF27-8]